MTIAIIALCITNLATLGVLFHTLTQHKSTRFTANDSLGHNSAYSTPGVADESQKDEESLARARRKLQAEMDAFDELMNFSADKAYGITPSDME